MIKEYVTPENTTIRLREAFIGYHEAGISDIIKYLRMEQYHLQMMLIISEKIKYYHQFDPAEIIDQGDDNELFKQTVEAELKSLDELYAEEALNRVKAHAVVEYLDSKEA